MQRQTQDNLLSPQDLRRTLKWTRIIFGLLFAAAVIFVVLLIKHMRNLGSSWPD
jgi:hypothetical protein